MVVGPDLPIAVGRSMYLEMNAKLQAQAMTLADKVTYLDTEEVRKVVSIQDYRRAWAMTK